jgi:replicative DNA helicase
MKKRLYLQDQVDPGWQLKIERVILSAILSTSEAIHLVSKDFQVKYFRNEQHIHIANAIVQLMIANKSIDKISLVEQLKKNVALEKSGGVIYLVGLDDAYSAVNIEEHMLILKQYWLSHYINECCNSAQAEIIEYKNDIFDVYANLQKKLDDAQRDIIVRDLETVAEIHHQILKKSYEFLDGKQTSGVPTGLERLDLLTNGFQSSDLIILAGRTSMGKTAFSLSVIIEPCINQKIPIAFFSLEMSKEQVVGRIQSILSKVSVSRIIKKQLEFEEINDIARKANELVTSPFYIDDTPNISLMELKSKSRKLVRENGVRMIIIDYLQLMKSGIKTYNREQEIAEISKGLKAIAKELNIPVIALSQLSRGVEQRGGNKKPMLSDLRDSGQIEQDADMVLFCFRPEYYGDAEYECAGHTLPAENLFVLIVSKHRNGVLGEIPLHFEGKYTEISDYKDSNRLYNSSSIRQEMVTESEKPKKKVTTVWLDETNNKNSSIGTMRPKNSIFEIEITGQENKNNLSRSNSDFENPIDEIDFNSNEEETPF